MVSVISIWVTYMGSDVSPPRMVIKAVIGRRSVRLEIDRPAAKAIHNLTMPAKFSSS